MSLSPNRHTLALAAILVGMWYAGAAQQNGGAYLLAFLIVSMAAVSWLHAKANLRGLHLEASVIPPTREGEPARVPLVLSVKDGRAPQGVEITARGVQQAIFIDRLSLDQPLRVELRVPATQAGREPSITVVARSHYPLGFFTASRVIEIQQSRLVLPRAAGDLPLPAVQEESTSSDAESSATTVGSHVEGDDFAGVREWQPGDSLRHIDWKAFARGRPLMVKQWSGAPAGLVWLNWEELHLPANERPGQLARWVDEAEQNRLRYGLRLPNRVIKPGQGEAHRLRCLESLASQGDRSGKGKPAATHRQQKLADSHETSDITGHHGVLLLGLSLLLTLVPLLGSVPWAGPLALIAALGLRALQQWRGLRVSSMPLRLAMVALGAGGTWLQEGSLQGLETGISTLLAVTAGKVLEARSPRDLQVLALLGWFLCLCALTLDQAMGRSLYALGVFMLITMAVVGLRSGSRAMKPAIRVAGTVFAQALPFVLLLFFLFPRGSFDIARRLNRALVHQTGMSTTLDPGSVARLAQTEGLAFYATIENAPVPDYSQRYWRCIVLWQGDGLHWERGGGLSRLPHATPSRDKELRQRIMLEPHGQQWLPALDLPTRPLSNTDEHYIAYDDDTLRTFTTVDGMRRFRVASHLTLESKSLPTDHERAALQLPRNVPAKVRELAQSFAQGKKPGDIVNAALGYFSTQGFRYTIEPGTYDSRRGLEDFLFDRRLGFCEHFAASFATIMRLAGVPARVVIGYLGGDYNETSNYLTVRQSDAHAWTEVWLDGQGWGRIDPTAALAPARLNTDLLSYLENGADGVAGQARNSGVGRVLQRAQLYWDHLNYLWYERVVQFGEMEQSELFADLGILKYRIRTLVLLAIGLFGLPLLVLWFWISRRARHPDPAVSEWLSLCRRLAKVGVPREKHEGPLAYARRAGLVCPAIAEPLLHAAQLYTQQRYGNAPADTSALRTAFRRITHPRLKPAASTQP